MDTEIVSAITFWGFPARTSAIARARNSIG